MSQCNTFPSLTADDLLEIAGGLAREHGLSEGQAKVLGVYMLVDDPSITRAEVARLAGGHKSVVTRCFQKQGFRNAMIDAGHGVILEAAIAAARALVRQAGKGDVKAAMEVTRALGITSGDIVQHQVAGQVNHIHDTLDRWTRRLGLGPMPESPRREGFTLGPPALGPASERERWRCEPEPEDPPEGA